MDAFESTIHKNLEAVYTENGLAKERERRMKESCRIIPRLRSGLSYAPIHILLASLEPNTISSLYFFPAFRVLLGGEKGIIG
jgi:hypothetical protein